ncbi:hypothetical protein D3C87_1646480 [compost metagenome]
MSAITPKVGLIIATTKLDTEIAVPKRAVVITESVPWLQYCLKNTGKNPAITVVA